MLKRDRTSEDRAFDDKVKTAIRHLGTNPAEPDTPTSYPYYLYWDRLGRKGQRCRIRRNNAKTAHIQFEDGFETVINRQALRRM